MFVLACATHGSTIPWSLEEQEILRISLELTERNATSFSSHRVLFLATLQEFRDRFAPDLDFSPSGSMVLVTCNAESTNGRLPSTAIDAAFSFIRISPVLASCLDRRLVKGVGTLQSAVLAASLHAIGPYSRLVSDAGDAGRGKSSNGQNIRLPSESAYVDGIAYLPIARFGDGSADRIETALNEFRVWGTRGLIVDLRDNTGGRVSEIARALDHFAEPGNHLFSVRGRVPRNSGRHVARGPNLLPNVPVVVLVNRSTASGGELAALSLRRLRSALIVGEPTAANTSIETVYPLGHELGARITTGIWLAPGDIEIPVTGVLPNVHIPQDPNRVSSSADEAIARALKILMD